MSLFNKLKTAFGFSDNDVEAEFNGDDIVRDATVTPLSQSKSKAQPEHHIVEAATVNTTPSNSKLPELPKQLPENLFLSVVKIINEQLPPIFKNNINEQAQAKQIYEALDNSHKEYIKSIAESVEKRTALMWEQDRTRLNDELKQLKDKSRKIEEKSEEWKNRQLSADRQKRALNDRVKDLMMQIDALQAEKEQYDLENKSLVNKIRVLSTQGEDTNQLISDNQFLRQELNMLKAKLAEAKETSKNTINDAVNYTDDESLSKADEALTLANAEIQQLHEQINNLNDKLLTNVAEIDTLTKTIASITSERDSLLSDIDTFKKRCEIADSMINELRSKAAEANKSESANSELTKQLAEKDLEIEALQAEITDANESIKEIEQIIGQFEDFKAEKESLIESLKATIQNNLLLHAEKEAALNEEIKALKEAANKAADKAVEPIDNEPIKLPDDEFGELNWLVSTPPAGTNARTSISDDEFGYQEPKRSKPHDVDPSQMSLF